MLVSTLQKKLMPREKILKVGAEFASVTELCAAIIGTGTQQKSALELGKYIAFQLAKGATPLETISCSKLGDGTKSKLLAAIELGKRLHLQILEPILTPVRAFEQAHELKSARKEMILGLYLDSRSRVLHKEILAVGGLNQASINPRDIFLPLREHPEINGLILLHNHPSGNPEPSTEDISFTQRVLESCRLLGIQLEDHLVVAGEQWISLRERGII